MTCSELMCNLEIKEKFGTFIGADGAKKFIRPLTSNWVITVAIPIIWVLTGICLACSWYYPFLLLTAKFLHNYDYNLFDVTKAMFQDDYYLFGVLVGMFCIIMPAIKHLSVAWVWIFDQKVRSLERNLEISRAIGKWAMLDVFTMSYSIFSLISDQIIPGCVVLNGLWFMIAYLVLNYTLDILTTVWVERIVGVALGEVAPNASYLNP